MIKIGLAPAEIFLIWTNIVGTNVSWTNITATIEICFRYSQIIQAGKRLISPVQGVVRVGVGVNNLLIIRLLSLAELGFG